MLMLQVFFPPSLLREHVELENLRGEHTRLLDEAKKEKVFYYFLLLLLCNKNRGKHSKVCLSVFLQLLLTNQLEMEKMKVEQEKKKCYLAQEALREKVLTPLRIQFNSLQFNSIIIIKNKVKHMYVH